MPKNRTSGQVGRSNGGGQSEIGRLAKSLRQALKGRSIDDVPHVTLMAMIAEAQGSTLNKALVAQDTDTNAGTPASADATKAVMRNLVASIHHHLFETIDGAKALEGMDADGPWGVDGDAPTAWLWTWQQTAYAALDGQRMMAIVDRSKSPAEYWSNQFGWTEHAEHATLYPPTSTEKLPLPIGGAWEDYPGTTDKKADATPSVALSPKPGSAALVDVIEDALSFAPEAFVRDTDVNGGNLVEWFDRWRERALEAVGDGRPAGATPHATYRAPSHSAMTMHDGKRFEVLQRLHGSEGESEDGGRLWLIRLQDGTLARAYADEIWKRAPRATANEASSYRTVTATFEVEDVGSMDVAETTALAVIIEDAVATHVDGVRRNSTRVFAETPTVVVDATGGIFERCVSDIPLDVVVVDSDGSNGFDSESVYHLPMGRGGKKVQAWSNTLSSDVDPGYVAGMLEAIEAGPRERAAGKRRIEVGTWLRFEREQRDSGDHGDRQTGPTPIGIVDGIREIETGTVYTVTFVPSRVQGCWTEKELAGAATVLDEEDARVPTDVDMARLRVAAELVEESEPDHAERVITVPGTIVNRLFERFHLHPTVLPLLKAAFGSDHEWMMGTPKTTFERANAILEKVGIADRF